MAELNVMPPARDTNNRDLAGGRTMGLAAGAELRKVHASSGRQRPGAHVSLEAEKLHFNQVRQIWGGVFSKQKRVSYQRAPSYVPEIASSAPGMELGDAAGVPELAGGKHRGTIPWRTISMGFWG